MIERLNPDFLLTSPQVCRILVISPKTLQLLRRNHKIAYLKFGHRSIRFREEAVIEFMRKRENAAEVKQ